MPQFTPKSLARLLLNVERGVLRAAVAEAQLWDVFSSFERDALIELGQEQNLMANLRLFPPTALKALAEEFFDRVEEVAGGAPMLVRMQFEGARKTWELVNDVRDIVNAIAAEPDDSEVNIPFAANRLTAVLNQLSRYLSMPHETHHPSPEADGLIISIQGHAEEALRALGVPV